MIHPTQMNSKCMCERSQVQKAAYCVIPCMWHFKMQNYKHRKICGCQGLGWRDWKGQHRRIRGERAVCIQSVVVDTRVYASVTLIDHTGQSVNFTTCTLKKNSAKIRRETKKWRSCEQTRRQVWAPQRSLEKEPQQHWHLILFPDVPVNFLKHTHILSALILLREHCVSLKCIDSITFGLFTCILKSTKNSEIRGF